MRAFVAHDADAYGHDILLQQAYAVQQKNIGKYTDDIAAIEEAIDVQTMLVVDPRVQKSRQMHAIATSHLGAMHHERFNKAMVSEYLDQAILLLQAAIERSSPQTNIHAECLHRLAQGYHTRYQSTSNFNDTVNAITALSEACDITRHNPHILEANLDTLLPWLSEYVEHCECTPVPLQAIACLRRVMQSFTGGPTHPLFRKMTALAVMLGHLLKERCKETQVLDELSNAIDHYRIMLSLLRHLPVDPYNTEVLWELTNLLDLRFLQTGESTDLDEAILMGTEALTLDPTPSDNASVGRLARLHFLRYNKVQRAADINDSILLRRRLLDSTSPDDPSHIDALKHLAVCLCIRGATSNREGDIEEALSISSKGLALSQLDPEQYLFFEGLRAHLLHQKFLLTRDIDHLNTATSILLQSQFNISSSAQLRLEVGAVLSGMVVSYWELHSTSHNAEHLYKAIACSQKYVAISNKPEAYHQLGNCLQRRFNITRSSSDISGAIDALSTSLRMSEASGDQPSPGLLLDLGGVIGHEASHIGDVGEYAKAEKLIKQAVLCSEEQESIHSRALVELIAHTGRKWWVDLQRTVRGSANDHEAELARQDSTVALGIRSDLATMEELLLRVPTDSPHYSRGQRMQDVMQQLQETSQNDSEYGFILLRIGYQASGNTHFRNLAIQRYRLGTSNTNENVMRRFLFARDWVEIFTVDDGGECLEAYDVAIGLLEMVVGLGQRISDRHSRVTDSGGHPRELGGGTQIWTLQRWAARLPVEAAAKAVQYDSIEKALEWLEQGRCLVWNQLQTLRTPLDDLERQEPQLAQRIRDMSKLLEHGGAEHTTLGEEVSPDFDTKIALAEGSARLARASKERDELIGQARKIPGFEDFLRPTRCSTLLQHLPDSGPVVVLNAHELRCDAIVLMRGMDEPLPVPLPKMTSSRAEAMQQGLKNEIARGLRMRQALRDGSGENRGADMEIEHEERGAQPAKCRPAIERILQELWESVVKPVLEALAFTTKSAIPTTRIWWCPTGPFSFLPIHAAGVYGRGASSECLADYAVSSYTPTVSALAARIRERRERNIGRNQLLLVSVPNAEGQASIPGTTREVQALHDFAIAEEIDHVRLEGEEATAESVMEEISRSSIVHLACHGSQNVTDPMQSGFYLHDKRLELSTIIKANVRNADLAFLSACQTSTGDEKLSNEAVHLAAGMMAAGFRGTVATMWAISDAHAPKVAEDFYSELWERGKGKGGGIDGEDAAYALHHSIQELKKIPMKNFGGVEKWFLTWVPYVHYGL
ncbi:CHAT domain-containing protein [Coprinopsis sp. MPI-PUGE-AT-0042]|nr:CHAT domain-containing protein [Coprinopsis sp. MPI-PUGE-AT-0042]